MEWKIKHTAAAVACGAVAAGCLWLWLAPSGAPVAEGGATAAATGGQERSRGAELPRVAPKRLAGRFALHYVARLQMPSQGGQKRDADVTVRAELELVDLPKLEGGPWVGGRARGATLDANELARRASGLGEATTSTGLGEPFLARLDADGRVVEVRLAQDLPVGIRALWAGVLRDVQFVVPAQANPLKWQADEANLNASFRADYARQADGRYLKQWRAGAAGQERTTDVNTAMFTGSGRAVYRFVADHLAEAQVELSGRTHMATGGVLASFRSDLRLTWQGTADATWAGGLNPASLLAFRGAAEAPRTARSTPVTLPDFEAGMAKARESKRLTDVAEMRRQLARTIAAEPRVAQEVASRLRQGGLDEPTERAYVEALVAAGTPAAQAAVTGLLTDLAVKEALAMRLLAGAAFFRRPDPAFVASLQTLSTSDPRPDVAHGAAVTLGAAIKHTAERDPKEGERLMKDLLDRATPRVLSGQPGAQDPGHAVHVIPARPRERASWLDGMGNAGLASALPLVLQALQNDPSDMVRKAAAHALRFMPGKEVKGPMTQAMAQEDSIFVREALLLAARWQGPQHMLSLVTHALRDDYSEHVRLAAAFTMATWAVDTPALKAELTKALATEKSSKVQESLKNYLQPGRTAPPFVPVGTSPGGQP